MKNKVSVDQMRDVVAAMAAVSMTAVMFYSPSVMCTLLLSSAVGMGLALADLATQFATSEISLVKVVAGKAAAKVATKK